MDTVKTTNSHVAANLINLDTQQILLFKLSSLEDGTFRIEINDPVKVRHTVPDALSGNPVTSKINVAVKDGVTILSGKSMVRINSTPFTINISTEVLSITINESGKMEFNSSEDDESIAIDVQFKEATTAYGIPLRAERLALKSTGVGGRDPYRMYNMGYRAYPLETPDSLTGAVPVLYAHSTQHTSGIFWLNSAETFVDLNTDKNQVDTLFMSESGAMDMFIFTGPTLPDCVRQYVKLTGHASLPPIFSLAYHQSRYSYSTQGDLERVIIDMDKNDFPVDVVWLDIDYTDSKKYFTWDYTSFPSPLEMQIKLLNTGRKLVVVIDPHIKVEKGYHIYDHALKNGYFVKNEDGSVFEGKCWPGISSYVDFINPDACYWWSTLFSFENFPDITTIVHISNDMNEPSVFESDERTMGKNLLHYDGWKHRDVHNIYGFMQTMGTYKGLLARSNNKQRPFVLTSSHFAGSQRYAAISTGENIGTWDHLRISIPMCLASALAGISFCGADVGGFVGHPSDELFVRWYQLGAWLPLFRAHSAIDSNRREPYLFHKEVQERLRRPIKKRYAHLPYWYTLWYEHEIYGTPVIRPLAYHYPKSSYTLDMDWEFMVGQNILVAPVVQEGVMTMNIQLPEGTWYNSDQNMIRKGPDDITVDIDMDWAPAFYRAGSIIPHQDKPRKSTVYMKNDPYNLYIYLDEEKNLALGNLYVDDFEGYSYRLKKQYLYMEYKFENDILTSRKIDEDAHFKTIILESTIVHTVNKGYIGAEIISGRLAGGGNVEFIQDGSNLIVTELNIDLSKEFKMKFY